VLYHFGINAAQLARLRGGEIFYGFPEIIPYRLGIYFFAVSGGQGVFA